MNVSVFYDDKCNQKYSKLDNVNSNILTQLKTPVTGLIDTLAEILIDT